MDCGRFTQTKPIEAVRSLCRFQSHVDLAPRYNIAPGQQIPVVWQDAGGERFLDLMTWGCPSPGANGGPAFNVRAEAISPEPAYRDAFAAHRCLIPADGFYEWETELMPPQPWRLVMNDEALFAFAGLWQQPASPGDPRTALIITVPANEVVGRFDDRMPAIIGPERADAWLSPDSDLATLKDLLEPYPGVAMKIHAVSARVNSEDVDDPMCIQEWDDGQLF
jgi:putative SOS response-associated peptidase YedK